MEDGNGRLVQNARPPGNSIAKCRPRTVLSVRDGSEEDDPPSPPLGASGNDGGKSPCEPGPEEGLARRLPAPDALRSG